MNQKVKELLIDLSYLQLLIKKTEDEEVLHSLLEKREKLIDELVELEL